MLQTDTIPNTDIVRATIDGGVSGEEIKTFRERITAMTRDGVAPNVLMTFRELDVSETSPQAFWEDLKSSAILDDLNKVAIVTDKSIIERLGNLADSVSSLTVKVYQPAQRDEAVAWLSARTG